MSLPLTVLTVGASLGVGAASAPVLASVLSKPITGSIVPTRVTDLAGYLVGSDAAVSRGNTARGFTGEDTGAQQSFGDPAADVSGIEDSGAQQSFDTTPSVGNTNNATTAGTAATVNAPKGSFSSGALPSPTAGNATADTKRLLALASFGGGAIIAIATFLLIRRVMR